MLTFILGVIVGMVIMLIWGCVIAWREVEHE